MRRRDRQRTTENTESGSSDTSTADVQADPGEVSAAEGRQARARHIAPVELAELCEEISRWLRRAETHPSETAAELIEARRQTLTQIRENPRFQPSLVSVGTLLHLYADTGEASDLNPAGAAADSGEEAEYSGGEK